MLSLVFILHATLFGQIKFTNEIILTRLLDALDAADSVHFISADSEFVAGEQTNLETALPKLKLYLQQNKPESGKLVIKNGTISLKNSALKITQVDFTADFSEQLIIVHTFSATIFNQTIRFFGHLTFERELSAGWHLRIFSSDFYMLAGDNSLFKVKYSEFNLDYSDSSLTVSSDISLEDSYCQANWADLNPPFFLKPLNHFAQLLAQHSGASRFNLRIETSGQLYLQTNWGLLETGLILELDCAKDYFYMQALFPVSAGYIGYLGRKFIITSGKITMSQNSISDSVTTVVKILAQHNIKPYENSAKNAYQILMKLSSIGEKTKFSLSSIPSLSEPDLIALLTIGKIRDQKYSEMDTLISDPSMKEIWIDRVKHFKQRQIFHLAEKKIGQFLDLEHIEFKGNLKSVSKKDGVIFQARKQLIERLDLTYTTVVGHAYDQTVKLNYKLGKHIYLEGITNQKGQTGVDLKFKYRFK